MKKILFLILVAICLAGCESEAEKEAKQATLIEPYKKTIKEQEQKINELQNQITQLNATNEKLQYRPSERLQQIKSDLNSDDLTSAKLKYNQLKKYYPESSETNEATTLIEKAEEKYQKEIEKRRKEEELKRKKERASGTILGLLLGAEDKEDALAIMKKKGYNFQEIGPENYACYKSTTIEGLTWNIVFLEFKQKTLAYVGFAKAYNSVSAFNSGMVHIITRLSGKYGDPSSDYVNNSVTYRDGRMAIVVSDKDMNGQSYLTLGYNDVYLFNFSK